MHPLRRATAVTTAALLCLSLCATSGSAVAPLPRAVGAAMVVPTMTLARVTRLVALGDSVPAGGACGCTPFPQRVSGMLAARSGHGVVTDNDALGGLTTHRLLSQLRYSSGIRRDVAAASVVLVTVGANDISSPTCGLNTACYAPNVRRVGTLLDSVVQEITRLRGGRPTAIVLTGYWNVWRDGVVARRRGAAYVTASVALTRAVNAQIAAAAARNRVTYVDLWVPFRGTTNRDDTALLAADGDHPNAAGHQVIAVAIARTLARRIPT